MHQGACMSRMQEDRSLSALRVSLDWVQSALAVFTAVHAYACLYADAAHTGPPARLQRHSCMQPRPRPGYMHTYVQQHASLHAHAAIYSKTDSTYVCAACSCSAAALQHNMHMQQLAAACRCAVVLLCCALCCCAAVISRLLPVR